jgi:hypothetical protein
MNDTLIPKVNSEFKLEKFDNEILLYSMTSTTAVYLNETAYLVYGMCGSGQTIGAIIALLEDAYPEQKMTIRADVIAALQQLIENGALLLSN